MDGLTWVTKRLCWERVVGLDRNCFGTWSEREIWSECLTCWFDVGHSRAEYSASWRICDVTSLSKQSQWVPYVCVVYCGPDRWPRERFASRNRSVSVTTWPGLLQICSDQNISFFSTRSDCSHEQRELRSAEVFFAELQPLEGQNSSFFSTQHDSVRTALMNKWELQSAEVFFATRFWFGARLLEGTQKYL